jgi:hypothetical protein
MHRQNLKLMSTTSARELWLQLCVDPLLVFSINLQSMNRGDNPARASYEYLKPYFRGNVAYAEIDFNFGTATSQNSYVQRLNRILEAFETGELQG